MVTVLCPSWFGLLSPEASWGRGRPQGSVPGALCCNPHVAGASCLPLRLQVYLLATQRNRRDRSGLPWFYCWQFNLEQRRSPAAKLSGSFWFNPMVPRSSPSLRCSLVSAGCSLSAVAFLSCRPAIFIHFLISFSPFLLPVSLQVCVRWCMCAEGAVPNELPGREKAR